MEEIHEITTPTHKTTTVIKNWLLSKGIELSQITRATPNGDFLRVRYRNYMLILWLLLLFKQLANFVSIIYCVHHQDSIAIVRFYYSEICVLHETE